ncbi:MAG: TrbC/VirB2 family protein [Clostridia bacterium]|nr:TrbC/VirB2 family protein [Clostridia bacterium]MDD4375175.1 TrbC/VirB2 family protein [Clostridia bacterium]
MNITYKNLMQITFIIIIIVLLCPYVIFADVNVNVSNPELKEPDKEVLSPDTNFLQKMGTNFWNNFSFIVQILAIASVVFAGVRYMFASADQKADIKKQTIMLVLGAILVFGAVNIMEIIGGALTGIF